MLKLNSKKFAENMRSYLLDCFENEENTEHLTPDQKFIYIYNRFESEYVHQYNLRKYDFNKTLIMTEWLSGLAISCDFYPYDIIKVAKELHNLDPKHIFSEKLEDKICDNWFNLLAIHIMKNTEIALEIKVKQQEEQLKELI
jgi:hypothetical protein